MLVVLIHPDDVDKLDEFCLPDMCRWWQGHAIQRTIGGETWFEVGRAGCKHLALYGGVKRLASFGVRARVARRTLTEQQRRERMWRAYGYTI